MVNSSKDKKISDDVIKDYLYATLSDKNKGDIELIVPKILKNTILSIDGFRYYLTGNNEKELMLRCEPQLFLDYKYERLFEQAFRFFSKWKDRQNEFKVLFSDSINKVETFNEEIFKNDNMQLYQELKKKYDISIFVNRKNWGKDKYIDDVSFEALSIYNQCKLIVETVRAFNRKFDSVDLRLIGETEHTGKIVVSKNINIYNNVYILNHSITSLMGNIIKVK